MIHIGELLKTTSLFALGTTLKLPEYSLCCYIAHNVYTCHVLYINFYGTLSLCEISFLHFFQTIEKL